LILDLVEVLVMLFLSLEYCYLTNTFDLLR